MTRPPRPLPASAAVYAGAMELSPGETRQPEPGLESAILAGQRGEAVVVDVLHVFAQWPMLVPSSTDSTDGVDPFRPVIFDKEGTAMMAVYTSPDRMVPVKEVAPYWATLSGLTVLKGLQPEVGIVINAGSGIGMELLPEAIPEFISMLEVLEAESPPEFGDAQTVLEQAIISAAIGKTSGSEATAVFAESDIFVPSHDAPTEYMSEISPVAFSRRDRPYVAVYSRAELIREPVTTDAGYIVKLAANSFSTIVGNGAGIIVNPGTAFEYLIGADALGAIA
jgi:hypothetical protein